jgi:hypothetical protein
MDNPHTLLKLKDASALTGLGARQLKGLILNGSVIGYRPSYKTYLINMRSLNSYIDKARVKPNNKLMGEPTSRSED